MNATFVETTQLSDAEMKQLRQATAALERVTERATVPVHAEWTRGKDYKGRALYTLRISAWEESASASFTWSKLRSPRELRWNLLELWGDLLQIRSHKLLENLTKGKDDPEV